LTGTGGIGKTRLAIQVAADLLESFVDGAYFVPLAPIREANLVMMAIAQTLGVRKTGSRALLESLVNVLHNKVLLLVLDNFEHIISAAPLVTDLLARCPRLKVLITSREVLHLRGEHEFLVPALALPVSRQPLPLATLTQYEAVQLLSSAPQRSNRILWSITPTHRRLPKFAYGWMGCPWRLNWRRRAPSFSRRRSCCKN
jgi:predicted ATPase